MSNATLTRGEDERTSRPAPSGTEDDHAYDPLARPTGWRHSRGWIFGEMLLFALFSLTAAFVLSVDAVKLAANPTADLMCDVNSVLSCGTVGTAWQSSVFGFPNAFLGLIAEPIVITVAVAGLGRTRFPRWFMLTAQLVYFLGVIFAYWLFYQSMFVIGALCPWCLVITVSTTLVFMSMLHWNVLENNLYLPPRVHARVLGFFRSGADGYLTAAWLVFLAFAILAKYGTAIIG